MAAAVEVATDEAVVNNESSETEPLLSAGNNPMSNSGTFLPDLVSALRSLHENMAANAPRSPVYRSLCDMARTAKQESNGYLSFMKLFFLEVYWALTCNLVITGVFVLVPLCMVTVGGIFWSECPVEPYIPIYLVAAGSGAVLSFVLVATHLALYERHAITATPYEAPTCLVATELIVFTFQFAWFLAGCVWIYSIYEPKYNPPEKYCGQLIYLFAFWINSVVWILLGICLVCFCLLTICFWRI